jgi:parvulin-like peptidyl-prolyl isomerase
MPRLLGRRLRAPALGVVACAVAVPLTGCGPLQSGAAAVIGSSVISVDRLQHITAHVLADSSAKQQFGSDVAALQRTELSRLIYSAVLERAAAARHVTVSRAAVRTQLNSLEQQAGTSSALKQQAALTGISPSEINSVARDIALSTALSDRLVSDVHVSPAQLRAAYVQNIDNYDKVHSAHILVHTKPLAVKLLGEVRANPARFPKLAQRYSIDTSSGANGGDLGSQGRHAFVPGFSNPVFKAKPGTFVLAHSQYGWHVVHVISHTHQTLAQAAPSLRSSLLQTEASRRFNQLLSTIAHRLHITVNPRFGKWDPSKQDVEPTPDTLSRPAVSTPSPTPLPAGG